MTILWVVGLLFLGGGALLLYYVFLPEGNESADPLKHIFGKEAWRFGSRTMNG